MPQARVSPPAAVPWAWLAFLIPVGSIHAGPPLPSDPVQDLRTALCAPIENATPNSADLTARRLALQRRVAALCRLPELREALLLHEWRDGDVEEEVAAIDGAARREVAERFERVFADVLRRGEPAAQLAGLCMLGEMSARAPGFPFPGGGLRALGPLLADLAAGPDPTLAEAAARAVGQIQAEPTTAVRALDQLLHSPEFTRRRAAAVGLANLVDNLRPGAPRSFRALEKGARDDAFRLVRAVLPVASGGINDPDEVVRRLSMKTVQATALFVGNMALHRHTSLPETLEELEAQRHEEQREQVEREALAWELREVTPKLVSEFNDPEPSLRLLAHETFETLAVTWARINQGISEAPGGAGQSAKALPQPRPQAGFLDRAPSAVSVLALGVADPEPQVRRAAVQALEALGRQAAAAAPALERALADRDRFVRWAAARTLGELGPLAPGDTAAALAGLLRDPDLDIRVAAAEALARLGPAARAAAPALTQAVAAGDAALRLAAMRALEMIGVQAPEAAVPTLAAALRAPEPCVRLGAAGLLGRLGPGALEARHALQATLNDADADVRKTSGDALLQILPPTGRTQAAINTPAARRFLREGDGNPRTRSQAPSNFPSLTSDPRRVLPGDVTGSPVCSPTLPVGFATPSPLPAAVTLQPPKAVPPRTLFAEER